MSVPVVVVIRTVVNVLVITTDPAFEVITAPLENANTPDIVHVPVAAFNKVKTSDPFNTSDAPTLGDVPNPLVLVVPVSELLAQQLPRYPEVTIPPDVPN